MTATLTPPAVCRAVPLGRDPQDLTIGDRVRVARPEFRGDNDRDGETAHVWALHRHQFQPRRTGKTVTTEPPRLLVWVLFADGRLAPKFADCLDRLEP